MGIKSDSPSIYFDDGVSWRFQAHIVRMWCLGAAAANNGKGIGKKHRNIQEHIKGKFDPPYASRLRMLSGRTRICQLSDEEENGTRVRTCESCGW